jgi:hypothetical protein
MGFSRRATSPRYLRPVRRLLYGRVLTLQFFRGSIISAVKNYLKLPAALIVAVGIALAARWLLLALGINPLHVMDWTW